MRAFGRGWAALLAPYPGVRPGAGGARQRSAPISKATWAAAVSGSGLGSRPEGSGQRCAAVYGFDPAPHAELIHWADLIDGAQFESPTAAVEICRRLDGIPLAIELAASRMASMSVSEVRDRLGQRFRLLVGSRRGLERHQTLRHTVEWSFDLLGPAEKELLQRCSVFAGGFDLAAAVAVAGSEEADEFEILDALDDCRVPIAASERIKRRSIRFLRRGQCGHTDVSLDTIEAEATQMVGAVMANVRRRLLLEAMGPRRAGCDEPRMWH